MLYYSNLKELIRDDIDTIVTALAGLPEASIKDTYAALQGTTPTANVVKFVKGRTAVNDGGHGQFVWIAGSTTTADGGTVLASTVTGYKPGEANEGRWKRQWDGPADVRWWGVIGDGTTDDTTAFGNALTSASGALTLQVPVGVTVTLTTVALPANTSLLLDGTIKQIANANLGDNGQTLMTATSVSNISITGAGTLDGNRDNQEQVTTANAGNGILKFDTCTDIYIDGITAGRNYFPNTIAGGSLANRAKTIWFVNCSKVRITNVFLDRWEREGILFDDGSDSVVSNCVGWGTCDPDGDNTDHSYSFLQADGARFIIDGCFAAHTGASGIGLDAADSVLSNCISYRVKWFNGFNFGHSGKLPVRSKVVGCIAYESGWGTVSHGAGNVADGFRVNFDTSGLEFSECAAIGSYRDGFSFTNLSSNVRMRGCRVVNAGRRMVFSYRGNVDIRGFVGEYDSSSTEWYTLRGAGQANPSNNNYAPDGIWVEGNNVQVVNLSDIRIHGVPGFGVQVSACDKVSAHNIRVTGSEGAAGADSDIALVADSELQVSNLYSNGSKYRGISLSASEGSTAKMTASGIRVENANHYGLYVIRQTGTLSNVVVTNSGNLGVYLDARSNGGNPNLRLSNVYLSGNLTTGGAGGRQLDLIGTWDDLRLRSCRISTSSMSQDVDVSNKAAGETVTVTNGNLLSVSDVYVVPKTQGGAAGAPWVQAPGAGTCTVGVSQITGASSTLRFTIL